MHHLIAPLRHPRAATGGRWQTIIDRRQLPGRICAPNGVGLCLLKKFSCKWRSSRPMMVPLTLELGVGGHTGMAAPRSPRRARETRPLGLRCRTTGAKAVPVVAVLGRGRIDPPGFAACYALGA